MNRIDKKFRELEKKNQGALIAFVTAGDPSIRDTPKVVDALIKGGVDLLELGLPFSDPIADGPTIQKASQRSLENGMNTDKYFSLVKKLDEKSGIPKICMTYYNLVLQRGLEKFARDCADTGIDGLIVSDLPPEESENLHEACRKNNIHLIFLVAPTTTSDRLKKISKKSRGFIYVVSLLGVTGAREKLSSSIKPLLKKIKRTSKKVPLAVGFGISKPEHVREVLGAGADGVIVGSAFVKIIEKNLNNRKKTTPELEKFARALKSALVS